MISYSIFFLTHFTWNNAFHIYPHSCKVAKFHSFYGLVVFHCIDKPHHLYPFICCWTLRLLPYFGKEIFKQTHKTVKNYYFGELELKVMESFFFLSTLFTLAINGTSLVVQWLRLHAPSARGLGSIPGQGPRSHPYATTKSSYASTKIAAK